MSWLEDWQQSNRERFPNAARFFDIFAQVHDEVRSDVLQGARDGALFSVGESAIIKRRLVPPMVLVLDSLLGAGFAASQHCVDAVLELTKSPRLPEQYDFSILSYTDPPFSTDASFFHDAVREKLRGDPISLGQIGDSPQHLERTLWDVVNKDKPISERIINALEHASITLPAIKLQHALNQELDRLQISSGAERERYFQSLGHILEERSGLEKQDDKVLSHAESRRRNVVGDVVNKTLGKHHQLINVNQTLETMNQKTHQSIKTMVAQRRAPLQDRTIDFTTINHGFQFLQSVGEITKNARLQKIAMVGQGSCKILSEIHKLSRLAATGVLTAGSFMSSIAAIGMAGSLLMKLFGRKKNRDDPHVIIMNQLRALSEQMAEFRQEVMQQFMQVQQNQRLIYEAVCQGFNLLYYSMQGEFEDLRYAVISRLEDIQSHLGYLERCLGEGVREISTQSLLETLSAIETACANYDKDNTQILSKQQFEQFIGKLTFWLISHKRINAQCKTPLLTGANVLPRANVSFKPHDYKRVLNLLTGETLQLGQILGFLVPYAQRFLLKGEKSMDLAQFEHPINIEIWCHITEAYIKLRKLALDSGIVYDNDYSELKTLLDDANKTLKMLRSIQTVSSDIFIALIEHYNQALQLLKEQLKIEVKRMLNEELLRLGDIRRLPLQNMVADVHGANLSLNGAIAEHVTVPNSLLLAQRLGLGNFVFKGERSERVAGHVRRHSNHNLGVSAVYPSARYIIDVYFQFYDEPHNLVPIATGEKYVPGNNDDSNPGNKKLMHVANANYARCCATLAAWMNKSLTDFFSDMWRGAAGLTFITAAHGVNEEKIQEKLVFFILKNHIQTMVTRDGITDCYLKLEFFYALINAYKKTIGRPAEEFFACLPAMKNSHEINTALIKHYTQHLHNNVLTIDDLFVEYFPPMDVMAVETEPRSDKTTSEQLPSPLAFPILEQVTELSSLFVTDAEYFVQDCESEDEVDLTLNERFSHLTVPRKEWTYLRSEDNTQKLPPIGSGGFAQVYSGVYYQPSLKLKRQIAIKTIPVASMHSNAEIREMFYKEVENLAAIKKQKPKHVVGFFGVSRHRNKANHQSSYSVLMELGKETLASYLNRLYVEQKKLTLEEQIKICLEIAKGIAEIHQMKLVHKDLKDSNVMLMEDKTASFGYQIKLADLGLGTIAQQTTLLHSTSIKDREGTLSWQAPEVVLGVEHTQSTDMFSYALLMWRVLHQGTALFRDEDSNVLPLTPQRLILLYMRTIDKRPTISNDINPQLKEIMQLCWQGQYTLKENSSDLTPLRGMRQRPTAVEVISKIETEFKDALMGLNQEMDVSASASSSSRDLKRKRD